MVAVVVVAAVVATATAATTAELVRPLQRRTEVGCPSGSAAYALLAGVAWPGSSADHLPALEAPALSRCPSTSRRAPFPPLYASSRSRRRTQGQRSKGKHCAQSIFYS